MGQLTGKIIITGNITTLTGLHIGGSKTTKKIGEVDNPIIRSANNVPYIQGKLLDIEREWSEQTFRDNRLNVKWGLSCSRIDVVFADFDKSHLCYADLFLVLW